MNCSTLSLPDGIISSSDSILSGTSINITCTDFGHRLTADNSLITCNNGTWSPDTTTFKCQWSWTDLNTHEKIVLGTSISAGIFLLLIIIIILIAYFCCYKRRLLDDDIGLDDGYADSSSHIKNNNYDSYGPAVSENGRSGVYPDTYLAYQEYPDKNFGVDNPAVDTGGINKPWLGYIPRPKIADRTYYNT